MSCWLKPHTESRPPCMLDWTCCQSYAGPWLVPQLDAANTTMAMQETSETVCAKECERRWFMECTSPKKVTSAGSRRVARALPGLDEDCVTRTCRDPCIAC